MAYGDEGIVLDTTYFRHGPSGGNKGLAAYASGRFAGLFYGQCIVHTARAAGPSIAYGGND